MAKQHKTDSKGENKSEEVSKEPVQDVQPELDERDVPAVGVDTSYTDYHNEHVRVYSAETEGDSLETKGFLSDDKDYAAIPAPDVFNAYPPEVQRKIIEWTDRDVKARRDDESRRQDEKMHAQVTHERFRQIVPTVIIILSVLCAAITGVMTQNPLFALAFLLVPLVIIIGIVIRENSGRKGGQGPRFPRAS